MAKKTEPVVPEPVVMTASAEVSPVISEEQQRFAELVKIKMAVGLPRSDAEDVARRQIAEEKKNKPAAA